jgi:heterodisulfide reductase subunit C
MTHKIASVLREVTPDSSFLRQVEEIGGAKISPCYLCVKCSGGCPLNFAMDIAPHRAIRMVQVGLKEEVLSSSAIWLCAGCETCATRCPNGVDLARLMDTLRQIALAEGIKPAEKNIVSFHKAFMAEIGSGGRIHEMTLVGRYKLRTRKWMQDVALGWEMFKRGKLKFLPKRVKGGKLAMPKVPKMRRGSGLG